MLKIYSAASIEGQGKLTCFMQFPWLLPKAGLLISTFCYLFERGGKQLFVIYTFLMTPKTLQSIKHY